MHSVTSVSFYVIFQMCTTVFWEIARSLTFHETILLLPMTVLLPVAMITGSLCGGFLATHPTGVTTNMVTGHLGKVQQHFSKILISKLQSKRLRQPRQDLSGDYEKLKLSSGVILWFFLGSLGGFALPRVHGNFKSYQPVFTAFGILNSVLLILFHRTYSELKKMSE